MTPEPIKNESYGRISSFGFSIGMNMDDMWVLMVPSMNKEEHFKTLHSKSCFGDLRLFLGWVTYMHMYVMINNDV